MIPKRLICTHSSQYSLEPKLRYCIEAMRKFHPEWEFLFFSDSDCREFVATRYPDYLELYDWYPRPVLRADLFRILAVHGLGGFYLDTDFLVFQALDPLCQHAAVFPWEHVVGEREFNIRYPVWMRTQESPQTLGNYAFGAEAGHPFLTAILDELVRRTECLEREGCNDLDILHATGPDAVTSVYYKYRKQWRDVTMLQAPYMGLGAYGRHYYTGHWRQDNYQFL